MALRDELVLSDNHVKIILTSCDDAIKRMLIVVLADEVSCRQEKGEPILISQPVEGKLFLQLWMKENEDLLSSILDPRRITASSLLGVSLRLPLQPTQ